MNSVGAMGLLLLQNEGEILGKVLMAKNDGQQQKDELHGTGFVLFTVHTFTQKHPAAGGGILSNQIRPSFGTKPVKSVKRWVWINFITTGTLLLLFFCFPHFIKL
jgi:hypothetical protein